MEINYKDKYIMALRDCAGLFEVAWDQDNEIWKEPECEQYKKTIETLRSLGYYEGRNTYVEQIQDRDNDLGF